MHCCRRDVIRATGLSAGARWAALLGLVLGLFLGCTEGARQAPPPPEELPEPPISSAATPASGAHPTGPPSSCALKLSSGDAHGTMTVAIVLQNRTKEPLVATYHHPLSFALQVWAGSKRLEVSIPPYDGPVQPRTITAPPEQRVTISTPVTLRFAADDKPQTDSPFEWLIISPPTDVRLRAKRVFTDMPDLTCELKAHFR